MNVRVFNANISLASVDGNSKSNVSSDATMDKHYRGFKIVGVQSKYQLYTTRTPYIRLARNTLCADKPNGMRTRPYLCDIVDVNLLIIISDVDD